MYLLLYVLFYLLFIKHYYNNLQISQTLGHRMDVFDFNHKTSIYACEFVVIYFTCYMKHIL